MSDQLQPSKKRLPLNHHHLTPSKKPKLPSSPPLHSPVTTFSADYDDIFGDLEDEEAEARQQELISNLLSSSPTKTTPFPCKVRFVSYPYLPLSPFECSSSYVTINGNEETCGSSFSDADSSLMASVDTCSAHISEAFGFLRVQNGDVFGSMVKSHEEEDVWDWSELLGEELI